MTAATDIVPWSGSSPARYPTSLAAVKHGRALVQQARAIDLRSHFEAASTVAAAQVAHIQLEAEVQLLLAGQQMAGDDPGLQYLVARKVAHFAERNNARLAGF